MTDEYTEPIWSSIARANMVEIQVDDGVIGGPDGDVRIPAHLSCSVQMGSCFAP